MNPMRRLTPLGCGVVGVVVLVVGVLALGAAIAHCDTPTPMPSPSPVVGFDPTAAVVIGHDIASGYQHPRLFFGVIGLGPHVGGFYMAGLGVLQGVDGTSATFVPVVTYVGQGYIHGWFKKLTFSAGVTQEKLAAGKPGWMFCIGIGR